ncbi:hypothetical protein Aduo_017409 [Ancylostoma duodenale]
MDWSVLNGWLALTNRRHHIIDDRHQTARLYKCPETQPRYRLLTVTKLRGYGSNGPLEFGGWMTGHAMMTCGNVPVTTARRILPR